MTQKRTPDLKTARMLWRARGTNVEIATPELTENLIGEPTGVAIRRNPGVLSIGEGDLGWSTEILEATHTQLREDFALTDLEGLGLMDEPKEMQQ